MILTFPRSSKPTLVITPFLDYLLFEFPGQRNLNFMLKKEPVLNTNKKFTFLNETQQSAVTTVRNHCTKYGISEVELKEDDSESTVG